jgi:hypothetical protein
MASLYDSLSYRLKNSGVNVIKRRIPFPAHNPQNIDKFSRGTGDSAAIPALVYCLTRIGAAIYVDCHSHG